MLNFALNLEYLEAEFYSYAFHGHGIDDKLTSGKGKKGGVIGGKKVNFQTPAIYNYAKEIAWDELHHVQFLRKALGGAKVARPQIDLQNSFTAAATAAGLIQPGQTFDPFANENNFLLAAYLFEDVGVTAYKGAAPLISNKTYLEAAAGILAVEAYHAGLVRSALYSKDMQDAARAISNARDSLDGKGNRDQPIGTATSANITPVDRNGIAFSRSAGEVLNVVYLNPKSVTKGGFFPRASTARSTRARDRRAGDRAARHVRARPRGAARLVAGHAPVGAPRRDAARPLVGRGRPRAEPPAGEAPGLSVPLPGRSGRHMASGPPRGS